MKEVSVFIAGGGPVGMTLAAELSLRGIDCLVAERNDTTTRHPKMDITNARSMELFRKLGIQDQLRAAAIGAEHPFDVSWVITMNDAELHRFAYPSVTAARATIRANNDGSQPLEPAMRVSQVEIEPVLRDVVQASAHAEITYGLEVTSFVDHGDHVVVSTRRRSDGVEGRYRAQYLIGCDGGGSVVRQGLGIGLTGDFNIMKRYMVHFRSDRRDLLQPWGQAWHYQSQYGTLIAQNDHDVWTLHSRFVEGPNGPLSPSDLITRFVGEPIEHEVLVANPWSPHLVVADSYGRGRVWLAGDAAHQYIPTGGYGMNTGIGDAFDLAWKLAAVLQGFGTQALVDSYAIERRPVGLRNCAGSRRHNEVRVAIGQAYAETADKAVLAAKIHDFGNLENESLGIEMGYHYHGSPVICADGEARPSDDPDTYRPSTVPGVRLPSTFLDDGSAVFDRLGPWFTLLNFGPATSTVFGDAAQVLGLPLTQLDLRGESVAPVYQAKYLLVRPDQHVAWRGEVLPDATEALAILSRATGRGAADVQSAKRAS